MGGSRNSGRLAGCDLARRYQLSHRHLGCGGGAVIGAGPWGGGLRTPGGPLPKGSSPPERPNPTLGSLPARTQ